MDFVEINHIIEKPNNSDNIDISFMLNYERKLNGADQKWLQNH